MVKVNIMNPSKVTRYIAYVIIMVVFMPTQNVIAQKGKAGSSTDLRIINVEDISDAQLQVVVQYNYTGKTGSKEIFIQAFPVESDGTSNLLDVDIEKIPLKSGTNRVSLKITKRPQTKEFTSENIKVCMIEDRSQILCKELSFKKLWKNFDTPVKIVSFISSESTVSKGDFVTLSWQTENTSNVMLGTSVSNDFKKVETSGKQKISVDKNTTYVLMASPINNSGGPVKVESKKLTVDVAVQPVIGSFYASRKTIRRGINTKLMWKVFGAEEVSLNGESVSTIGEKIISPIKTSKYTLEAKTGDVIISEDYIVMVTPFGAPKLEEPISSIELCRNVDDSGESYRCISSDGPFSSKDKINAIVRIQTLSKESHNLKLITYNSFDGEKWIKVHQENRSIPKRDKDGYLELNLEVKNTGEGKKKLELILNENINSKSEIVYCIDCPRMWE